MKNQIKKVIFLSFWILHIPFFAKADGMDAMGDAIIMIISSTLALILLSFINFLIFRKLQKISYKFDVLIAIILFLFTVLVSFLIPVTSDNSSMSLLLPSSFTVHPITVISLIIFAVIFSPIFLLNRLLKVNLEFFPHAFLSVFLFAVFLSVYAFLSFYMSFFTSSCNLVANPTLRSFCYKNIALETKDDRYCSKSPDPDDCFKDLAVLLQNNSMCEKISDATEMGYYRKLECYLYQLPRQKSMPEQISFCDGIPHQNIKDACFGEIQWHIEYNCQEGVLDRTTCKKHLKKYLADTKESCLQRKSQGIYDCLFNSAISQGNPFICLGIEYKKTQFDCVVRAADSINDIDVCAAVQAWQTSCYVEIYKKFDKDLDKKACQQMVKTGEFQDDSLSLCYYFMVVEYHSKDRTLCDAIEVQDFESGGQNFKDSCYKHLEMN